MNARDEEKPKQRGDGEAEGQSPTGEAHLGRCYEICVGAQLDSSWSEWFEGLEMRHCGKNSTILFGRVDDQAALLGILNKLCRLNLPLVSLNEIEDTDGGTKLDREGGE